ncbi:hypothetical protein ARMSODRAFT_1020621 [Armillaria solidipes]|uniref:Family A G protein-coupled receptor-like protein n=1 Tax=Armillaria solidipes TaxID=1076256 RepID=A0A2H3B9U9_9AGAR|nr:hypothetical protein ARMSODRAFT_1020621 [Armillaria solidipes]
MATQTDIPSDLPNDDKAYAFQCRDAQLNSTILYALLHGIYTGILAVTLWNIFINKCWPIRRAMVIVIILLHALITVNFSATWSYIHSAFIQNGQNFWTVYLKLNGADQAVTWEMGITASISAILTDLYMIWYCWMIWGRRWLVVLLPLLSLASAIVSKIMEIYYDYVKSPANVFLMLYISFSLATTLLCTFLISYRIVTVAGARRGAEGRLRVYHRFIEVLVESSALYLIPLIIDLAFTIRGDWGEVYPDVIASIVKGIAPTLLVGRITVGHRARPDDSWQGSVVASASIRSQEQEQSRTSSQEDSRPTSPMLDGDLEAQRESGEPSPIFIPGPDAQSQGMTTLPTFENFPLYHPGDTGGSNRVSVESSRLCSKHPVA